MQDIDLEVIVFFKAFLRIYVFGAIMYCEWKNGVEKICHFFDNCH